MAKKTGLVYSMKDVLDLCLEDEITFRANSSKELTSSLDEAEREKTKQSKCVPTTSKGAKGLKPKSASNSSDVVVKMEIPERNTKKGSIRSKKRPAEVEPEKQQSNLAVTASAKIIPTMDGAPNPKLKHKTSESQSGLPDNAAGGSRQKINKVITTGTSTREKLRNKPNRLASSPSDEYLEQYGRSFVQADSKLMERRLKRSFNVFSKFVLKDKIF